MLLFWVIERMLVVRMWMNIVGDVIVSMRMAIVQTCANIFTVVKELGLSCGGNGLGHACQRIIDYGRCEFMRNTLFSSADSDVKFDVRLLHYVPRNVTPQNALLIAFKK